MEIELRTYILFFFEISPQRTQYIVVEDPTPPTMHEFLCVRKMTIVGALSVQPGIAPGFVEGWVDNASREHADRISRAQYSVERDLKRIMDNAPNIKVEELNGKDSS